MNEHPLKHVVRLQKEGKQVGIYSACTSSEIVLRACMERAKETSSVLLIEATANQVDQYGGYTGMKPADFMKFIQRLAGEEGIPMSQIILGGDHLGPLTFTRYNEDKAMAEARELIRQFVLAGFTKIHLDTSMKVASDDPDTRLSDEVISRRGAELAQVAEDSYKELLKTNPNAVHPVYIVGSEVPIPGGSQQSVDTGLQVTKVEDFKNTVSIFEKSFHEHGLDEAWNQVVGFVVQPGVEEKDAGCTPYDRSKAVDLMASIKEYPNFVFEGHSTDYQTKYALRELVEDGVGILKVGPGLSFAAREGLFALAYAEKEVFADQPEKQSHFREVLDAAMVANPVYYQKHFSDRSRYYMPTEEVRKAQEVLFNNFKDGVPLGVLSQFMPLEYTKVREGRLHNDPLSLVKDRVIYTVDEYLYASHQNEIKF